METLRVKIEELLKGLKAAKQSIPRVVTSEHGFKTNAPEQNALINGLNIDTAVPSNRGLRGAAFASSGLHKDQAVIKNSAHYDDKKQQHLGHNRKLEGGGTFNAARREVLFHDMAKHFFGMGKYVPTTAGFNLNGDDWSAQKKVGGAEHVKFMDTPQGGQTLVNPNHVRILRNLNNSGELDKLAMMDHIMAHHDRHTNNFMLDKLGNGMHLIDNGDAFDYGQQFATDRPRYRDIVHDLELWGPGGHNSRAMFHPEAVKWLQGLNHEDALKVFAAHGHGADSPAIKGFLGRLGHLQQALSRWDAIARKPAAMLIAGKAATYQEPHEFQEPVKKKTRRQASR